MPQNSDHLKPELDEGRPEAEERRRRHREVVEMEVDQVLQQPLGREGEGHRLHQDADFPQGGSFLLGEMVGEQCRCEAGLDPDGPLRHLLEEEGRLQEEPVHHRAEVEVQERYYRLLVEEEEVCFGDPEIPTLPLHHQPRSRDRPPYLYSAGLGLPQVAARDECCRQQEGEQGPAEEEEGGDSAELGFQLRPNSHSYEPIQASESAHLKT